MNPNCADTLSNAYSCLVAAHAEQHIIELSHFDAYFHLFASLNLAYAGSKTVRAFIDREILQIKTRATTSIAKLRQEFDDIANMGIAGISGERAKKKFEGIIEEYKKGVQVIEDSQKPTMDKYNGILKLMFLNTAVYVFLILLVAGFQQTVSVATTFNYLLFFNVLFLYNIYVFVISYHPDKTSLISWRVTLVVIGLMVSTAIVHCIFCPTATKHYSYINPIVSVCFCLFFCVSPFLLAFLRGNSHRRTFTREYSGFVKQKLQEIKEFNSRLNWLNQMQDNQQAGDK